jgi:D-psicose/D-tagatose/L-ribulose 3-epimerase
MAIKIGMNMLLWGTQIGPAQITVIEELAGLGFDGVEIPVTGQAAEELQAMAQACDDLGLQRTASTFLTPEANPIAPQASVRRNAVDYLKCRVDEAVLIGAPILIGGLYQAHKYFTGRAANADEWQWSVACLQEVGEYAAQRGVSLGLECLNRFETFLVNSSADGARLVRDIGLANVGVHYDTHHANIEDPPPRVALGEVAAVLNHIHLSESHRGTLGTGQVDWSQTFTALRDIDYNGWLVIEAFGADDPVLASAANVWRNAFESPTQLCRDGIAFIREHV